MTKSGKMKTGILICAAAAALCVGSAAAYFTDSDTAVNTFTIGKVELDLQEPGYVPETDITPGEEIQKDPQIKNTGVNDEYVFLTVTIPYANITVAEADGTKGAKADTELFTYTVNSGWTELGAAEKNTSEKFYTHTYVYGTASACTALAANTVTPALFNTVKMVNAVEDEGLENTSGQITVNAYGIQTSNLGLDGSVTSPSDILNIVRKQAPASTKTNEDAVTDIVGN